MIAFCLDLQGKERSVKQGLLRVLLVLTFAVAAGFSSYAEVTARLTQDEYVLPVAELASTKTYPDIITLTNDLVRVQLIPNRGRPLVELTSLSTNTNYLYRNLNPDPMILPSGLHGVEFGGYYFTLPWNTRDRQPFDLHYEITASGPELAEVYLSGKDIFARTLTEVRVRLREGSPVVEMELALTNTSSRGSKKVEFGDVALFSSDTEGKMQNSVMLPVERVEVLSSAGQWLGSTGQELPWPAAVETWGKIRDYFRVRTAGPMSIGAYGIRYPGLRSACMKLWQPAGFFDEAELWSWGEQYKNNKGTGPYFGLSSARTVELQPKERISAVVYMVVLDDVAADASPASLYERAARLLGK